MLNATIISRKDLNSNLIIISVKPDDGVPDFLPGQYVALGVMGSVERPAVAPPEREVAVPDKVLKRAYSIGSSPHQKEALEFFIAIVPEGSLTPRLSLYNVGNRVFVAPKITGTFTLKDVPDHKSLILISTGTGLAPYVSMLRTPSTWIAGRSITLIHGVRHAHDFAYQEELAVISDQHADFRFIPIVSRESPGWLGAKGRVQQLFIDKTVELEISRDHVFLCGNPAMIDDMEALLVENGFTLHSKKAPGNIHLERYW